MDKVITYSLLAYLRNNTNLNKGTIDIFVPLIKRTLSQMANEGVFHGKSILEIKNYADELYCIDFPLPIIDKILKIISFEINTPEKKYMNLYDDGSFLIDRYVFVEIDKVIDTHKRQIIDLEKQFKSFCKIHGINDYNSKSIFDFIESNKLSLGQYLNSYKVNENEEDFEIQAKFVDHFRNTPSIYLLIENIYLGSIISSYVCFEPKDIRLDLELVLDTNFIISFLDLNTPESTLTCKKLIEICRQLDISFVVLDQTIKEIDNLIRYKIETFNKSYLLKIIYPEDIHNACDRRSLSIADLEQIRMRFESILIQQGIKKIDIDDSIVKTAKSLPEFEILKRFRSSYRTALHDAIGIAYVRNKRNNKLVSDFENSKCWFVNNSKSGSRGLRLSTSGALSETINAGILLNIIWLSNPKIQEKMNIKSISNLGLSSMVSMTLNANLPNSSIIKELNDNINKYAKENISDEQVVLIGTRLAALNSKDVEQLNLTAKNDTTAFCKKLTEISNDQKKIEDSRKKKHEMLINSLSVGRELLDKKTAEVEKTVVVLTKSKQEMEKEYKKKLETTNEYIKTLLDNEHKRKIFWWKIRPCICLAFSVIVLSVFWILRYKMLETDWSSLKSNIINDFGVNTYTSILSTYLSVFIIIPGKLAIDRLMDPTKLVAYKKLIDAGHREGQKEN